MSRPRKQKNLQKPQRKTLRRYHLVDDDAHSFESLENPDWLVGAD